MQNKPLISLVVPVFNEEDNLPILFNEISTAMADSGAPWEVVFVDDGSTDGSLAALRRLAEDSPRVKYLSLAANRGQSAAFKAGFDAASGEVIVTLDADLQNDPADIPRLLALYAQGHDMVIGWREKRQDSLMKRVGSRLANRVRDWFTRETVRDTGCSLKVLRASMARELPMFTGMHRFLPTLMKLEGATVAEVPVNHRPRGKGVSKYGIWDRAWASAYDLLAVRWMQKRHIGYVVSDTNLK